jgi:hypothetical protein
MDEAIHRLQQAAASDQLRASMARATRVVAQQAAVKEVSDNSKGSQGCSLRSSRDRGDGQGLPGVQGFRPTLATRTSNTPSEALADAVQGLLVGVKANELFQ